MFQLETFKVIKLNWILQQMKQTKQCMFFTLYAPKIVINCVFSRMKNFIVLLVFLVAVAKILTTEGYAQYIVSIRLRI